MSGFISRGVRTVRRRIHGSFVDRIRRLNPADARAVAAVISDLRDSIQRRGASRRYAEEVINAMRTSNYEIARFILAHWDWRRISSTAPGLDATIVRYLRTDEYKFGNGFDLVDQLMRFMGMYDDNVAPIFGPPRFLFEPNALNALLEPHYTRDAASIFGADANADTAENRVIVLVARFARSIPSIEASCILCMWFLTKLLEFGPTAQLRPIALYDDEDEHSTIQKASDAVYNQLEYVVTMVYRLHARQELDVLFDGHIAQELAPKLCEAVQACPDFRRRVKNPWDPVFDIPSSFEIDPLSICGPVIAADAAAADAPTEEALPMAAFMVTPEEKEKEEENLVVATSMPAPAVARREEIPAWARFSDPEEVGVRLQKRSPTNGGGTNRRRRRSSRHAVITHRRHRRPRRAAARRPSKTAVRRSRK
jgi:hypothetical protein